MYGMIFGKDIIVDGFRYHPDLLSNKQIHSKINLQLLEYAKMIRCPYNELELKLSVLLLSTKLSEERMEQITPLLEKLHFPIEEKMKRVAEFIGISLETLIASPNMAELVNQFEEAKMNELIDIFQKELDLTHKEAWSLLILSISPQMLE